VQWCPDSKITKQNNEALQQDKKEARGKYRGSSGSEKTPSGDLPHVEEQ